MVCFIFHYTFSNIPYNNYGLRNKYMVETNKSFKCDLWNWEWLQLCDMTLKTVNEHHAYSVRELVSENKISLKQLSSSNTANTSRVIRMRTPKALMELQTSYPTTTPHVTCPASSWSCQTSRSCWQVQKYCSSANPDSFVDGNQKLVAWWWQLPHDSIKSFYPVLVW